jgi:hypothetical protein
MNIFGICYLILEFCITHFDVAKIVENITTGLKNLLVVLGLLGPEFIESLSLLITDNVSAITIRLDGRDLVFALSGVPWCTQM